MKQLDKDCLGKINELQKVIAKETFYQFFERHGKIVDINELEPHGLQDILNSAGMIASLYQNIMELDKVKDAHDIAINCKYMLEYAHILNKNITKIFTQDLGFQDSKWYQEKIHGPLNKLQKIADYIISHDNLENQPPRKKPRV